jgi:hypothetical protein
MSGSSSWSGYFRAASYGRVSAAVPVAELVVVVVALLAVTACGVLEVGCGLRTRGGQAGPEAGQVPAALARRRSRLAVALGTRPVPWWVSPAWTVAAGALPILLVLACGFTVITLAAG